MAEDQGAYLVTVAVEVSGNTAHAELQRSAAGSGRCPSRSREVVTLHTLSCRGLLLDLAGVPAGRGKW